MGVLAGVVGLVVDTVSHHMVTVMMVPHLVLTGLPLAAIVPLAWVAGLVTRGPNCPEVHDRTWARALEFKRPARLHVVIGREDHGKSAEAKTVAVTVVTIPSVELGRTNCHPRVEVVDVIVRLYREVDARGAFEAIVVAVPRAIATPGAVPGPIVTRTTVVPPVAATSNSDVRRLPVTIRGIATASITAPGVTTDRGITRLGTLVVGVVDVHVGVAGLVKRRTTTVSNYVRRVGTGITNAVRTIPRTGGPARPISGVCNIHVGRLGVVVKGVASGSAAAPGVTPNTGVSRARRLPVRV